MVEMLTSPWGEDLFDFAFIPEMNGTTAESERTRGGRGLDLSTIFATRTVVSRKRTR